MTRLNNIPSIFLRWHLNNIAIKLLDREYQARDNARLADSSRLQFCFRKDVKLPALLPYHPKQLSCGSYLPSGRQ